MRYARRVLLGCFILNMTKLSGSGIVQSYQSLFYAGLGFKGQTILLISGFYGIMGVVGQLINIAFVSDKWPRRRTMCKFTGPLRVYPTVTPTHASPEHDTYKMVDDRCWLGHISSVPYFAAPHVQILRGR